MTRIEHGFTESDRPQVAELYWEAFGAKLGRAMGPRTKALLYLTQSLNPARAICARTADGTLVGVAGFETASGGLVNAAYNDIARVYGRGGAAWRIALFSLFESDTEDVRFLLDGLFVTPKDRSQGVGTALLWAVVAEARRRGYAQVRLDVIDGNERARALYEREGFRPAGALSTGFLRYIFGFHSATIMVRDVPS